MIRRLFLLLIATFAAACCPCRHLASSSADSVRVETRVWRERVTDTVYLEVPVERDRYVGRDTVSHLETRYATSEARLTPDGLLHHTLANKPGPRPVAIQKEIEHRDSIVSTSRVAVEIVERERPLTRWQQVRLQGFWALLLLVALSLYTKIKHYIL